MVAPQIKTQAAPKDYSNLTREELEREVIGLLNDVAYFASEQTQANEIVDQRLASIESKLGLTFHGNQCND